MSLEPAKHTFSIWKGSTFSKTITLYDVDGTLHDFTGHTASMTVEAQPGGSVVLTLNTSNGGILLGGTAGTLSLLITDEATAALTWTSGVYQLTMTAVGATEPLLWGKIAVKSVQ